MNKLFFKTKNEKLSSSDVVKFYALKEKLNPISDIVGVLSKNFKQTLKYIKHKYDKSFTILANEELGSIVVVKEDFLEKYLIIGDLDILVNSNYKFKRYI